MHIWVYRTRNCKLGWRSIFEVIWTTKKGKVRKMCSGFLISETVCAERHGRKWLSGPLLYTRYVSIDGGEPTRLYQGSCEAEAVPRFRSLSLSLSLSLSPPFLRATQKERRESTGERRVLCVCAWDAFDITLLISTRLLAIPQQGLEQPPVEWVSEREGVSERESEGKSFS
jgi:hypothetical protein